MYAFQSINSMGPAIRPSTMKLPWLDPSASWRQAPSVDCAANMCTSLLPSRLTCQGCMHDLQAAFMSCMLVIFQSCELKIVD